MSDSNFPPAALAQLRNSLARIRSDVPGEADPVGAAIVAAKGEVTARYAPVFAPGNLSKLKAEDFRSFLIIRNNRHWQSLQRRGPQITKNMKLLRAALKCLLDESKPIAGRLDRIKDGDLKVPFLGKSILTPILLVVYPDRYGVWNNASQRAMQTLGLWPEFGKKASFGEQYEAINTVQRAVARELGTDLWTLDALWWRVPDERDAADNDESYVGRQSGLAQSDIESSAATFVLEAHLHEFLEANWDHTELAKEWDLLEEDGEVTGSHYRTSEVGEIDLLAKHKRKPRWLVVELKRNQTSDATVGQVLRYMSWVKRNLAKKNEQVQGLIMCHEADAKLQYAIADLPDVGCMTYEVSFQLNAVTAI